MLQIRSDVDVLFVKVFKEAHYKNAAICVIKNSEPCIAIIPHKLNLEMLRDDKAGR
jgi:hypothetical protein